MLRLIAAGQSNRAITQALFIRPNTVLHHVSSIFAKLGVANRAEAAASMHRGPDRDPSILHTAGRGRTALSQIENSENPAMRSPPGRDAPQ